MGDYDHKKTVIEANSSDIMDRILKHDKQQLKNHKKENVGLKKQQTMQKIKLLQKTFKKTIDSTSGDTYEIEKKLEKIDQNKAKESDSGSEGEKAKRATGDFFAKSNQAEFDISKLS